MMKIELMRPTLIRVWIASWESFLRLFRYQVVKKSWLRACNSHASRNYLLKVNNRNTRTRCEICSKLTLKIPKQRQWCRSGVFIVNFEHMSHLVLVFLLLTLNTWLTAGISLECFRNQESFVLNYFEEDRKSFVYICIRNFV